MLLFHPFVLPVSCIKLADFTTDEVTTSLVSLTVTFNTLYSIYTTHYNIYVIIRYILSKGSQTNRPSSDEQHTTLLHVSVFVTLNTNINTTLLFP